MSDDVLSKYEGLTFSAETVEDMANEMAENLTKILEQEPCPVVEIPPQSNEAIKAYQVQEVTLSIPREHLTQEQADRIERINKPIEYSHPSLRRFNHDA